MRVFLISYVESWSIEGEYGEKKKKKLVYANAYEDAVKKIKLEYRHRIETPSKFKNITIE